MLLGSALTKSSVETMIRNIPRVELIKTEPKSTGTYYLHTHIKHQDDLQEWGFNNLIHDISHVADTVAKGVTDSANTVANGVIDAANTVANGVPDSTNTVGDALKVTINNVVLNINDVVNKADDAFNKV